MHQPTFTKVIYGLSALFLFSCSSAQQESGVTAETAQLLTENIRLNQVGFYPNATKVAVVVGENKGGEFYVKTADKQETVYTGQLSDMKPGEFSNRPTRIADFSEFKEKGNYVIDVPGVGHSYPFEIGQDATCPYEALEQDMLLANID